MQFTRNDFEKKRGSRAVVVLKVKKESSGNRVVHSAPPALTLGEEQQNRQSLGPPKNVGRGGKVENVTRTYTIHKYVKKNYAGRKTAKDSR